MCVGMFVLNVSSMHLIGVFTSNLEVTAVATVPVPKITLIVGGSHGAGRLRGKIGHHMKVAKDILYSVRSLVIGTGNYGMCGRAYDPRFLFTWPNSRISVMGGPQAASVLSTVKNDQMEKQTGKPMTQEENDAFEARLLEKYEQEGSPYFATARLWDDGVIQIEETRTVLGQALRVVSKDFHPLKEGNAYGVFRT
jgi:3-methylcrotonyl-CoA carboxylase beta subunit